MANAAEQGTGQHIDLTAAEIAALALSLAHLGTGPQSRTARRALSSLIDLGEHDEVIASTLATLTTPLEATVADRARVVANAITEHRVVRVCYTDAKGIFTVREVEPVTCLVHREHWYLVGWCRMRTSIRAFRFDRLLAVEPTDIAAGLHRTDQFLPFQRRTALAA